MDETYVKINLDNVGKNAKTITTKYNGYMYYIGIVKSDAYGHGEYIVNELINNGINYLAVAELKEALNIRKFNKNIPILCMEPLNLRHIDVILKNNITIIIHSISYLKELLNIRINKKLKIHLKIDSGLGRLGFKDKKELFDSIQLIKNNKYIEIEGIYTHFATIGIFDKYWDKQLQNFLEITSLIELSKIPIIHLGSSLILISHPKIEFANGIRIGTLLYGYNISPQTNKKGIKNKLRLLRNKYYQKKYKISKTFTNIKLDIKPVMSFYSIILNVKKINKGEHIGYGAKYIANEDMYIAIIPVGYNNGIGTKNIGRFVFINNKKYNIISTIEMNMSFVKVDNTIKTNDKVILMEDKRISVGQMGRFAEKTMHEILLDIGKNNTRVYEKNNKIEFIEVGVKNDDSKKVDLEKN